MHNDTSDRKQGIHERKNPEPALLICVGEQASVWGIKSECFHVGHRWLALLTEIILDHNATFELTLGDINHTFSDMHLLRGATLNGFDKLVAGLGLDSRAILIEAGLPANALLPEAADHYLPIAGMERAYAIAERNSQQLYLAARLGSRQEMSTLLGVVGFVMQQCNTVGEALAELTHYFSFQVRGAYLQIIPNDDQVALVFSVEESFRLPSTRHTVEFALAASVSVMQSLCGESWKPMLTQFMHTASKDSYRLETYFHSSIHFNQEQNAVIFRANDLEHEITSANPELNKILHGYLSQLEDEFTNDTLSQVEKLIQQALSSGSCDANKVAAFMGVHRRTLHRILKKENTTFTLILEKVRRDLATKMLLQGNVSISFVADILCYSEPSAFTRAFRRWFGCTPQQYRLAPHPPEFFQSGS